MCPERSGNSVDPNLKGEWQFAHCAATDKLTWFRFQEGAPTIRGRKFAGPQTHVSDISGPNPVEMRTLCQPPDAVTGVVRPSLTTQLTHVAENKQLSYPEADWKAACLLMSRAEATTNGSGGIVHRKRTAP
jgi:hypothetical protein